MNRLRISVLVYATAIILLATQTGCTSANAPKSSQQTADAHPSAGLESNSPQPASPESRGDAPVDSQAQTPPNNGTTNETATATTSNNAAEKVKGNGQGRARGRSSTPDTTPPTIVIGSPTPSDTSAGPVTYLVSYNEADSITLRKRDVTLNTTGTALGSIAVSQSGAKSRTIEISNITGNGTLAITIAPGTAVDAAGNVATGAGPSETVQIDNPAPTLSIGAPSDAATNAGPVSFAISYANADTVTLAEQDITLSSPEGVTGTVTVSGSGTTERTVTVDNITGIGTFTISIAAGTAENVDGETASNAGPSAPVDVYGPQPTLEPGPGFDGPTPEPPAIGTGPGSDAKAIARWDVVPYQTFDGIFQIGVVAFHINGIDRVEFSLEGGPWTAAMPVMTRNPRTDVVEYWVNLDASLLPDGPIEIRAIAYPTVGIPRVLGGDDTASANGQHSIFLNANVGQSLNRAVCYVAPSGNDVEGDGTRANPFQSILNAADYLQAYYGRVDDCIIYLLPGNYPFAGKINNVSKPITENAWLTIAAAPDIHRDQVRITQGGSNERVNASRIRLRGLTLVAGLVSSLNLNHPAAIWLDDCVLTSEDRTIDTMFAGPSMWEGGIYVTDSFVHDTLKSPYGVHLCRNLEVDTIGSDAFQNDELVLNCRVNNIDSSGTDAHPDVWQVTISGRGENYIGYGIVALNVDAQGIFFEAYGTGANAIEDVAIVNVLIEKPGRISDPGFSQWSLMTKHLLISNITIVQQFIWTTSELHNISIRDSVFGAMGGVQNIDPGWVWNCHFLEIDPVGSEATYGPAGFVNSAQDDFRPAAGSPLVGRQELPLVPVDAAGIWRRVPTAIGALEGSVTGFAES